MFCGSVNLSGSFKYIWRGTMQRCAIVGRGVALLEEMCHSVGGP